MLGNAWPAPAKLNLFLHINGRRDDGYHLLQTAFQFIDLCDEIDFTILPQDEIKRSTALPDIATEDDLTIRAARELKRFTSVRKGVNICVRKRIPIGGGLGGGSSDAATTLVALNHLWQTGCSTDELARLGLALGADVPVFIHAHAAWAEGIGERITAIEPAERFYLVIYPGCGVSTATVFNAPDLTRNTPVITIRDFLERGGKNDCESTVRKHYNHVAKALDWLNGYVSAGLTGTGACIFAPFEDRQEALELKKRVPEKWRGYVVKGMNRSPLTKRLANETTLL